MKYFNYETGLTMINEKFGNYLVKQRKKDDPIKFHQDIAAHSKVYWRNYN